MESLARENVSIAHKLHYVNLIMIVMFYVMHVTKGDVVWKV